MPSAAVARRRLASLGLAPAWGGGASAIGDVARHLLAMQAQDYASGLWSVGVRTGASAAEVEEAISNRVVTRSWPMRGTLHLMATEDVKWMCLLLGARADSGIGARWAELQLDERVLGRARELVVEALEAQPVMSRPALFKTLEAGGIDPSGQRGVHLLGRLCREALLCQGPLEGRQTTFVLLDEWVPRSWEPGREEAMAALADRYVRGHGPVTERDFAGWAGQTLGFAREAIALAGDRIRVEEVSGTSYLVHVDEPTPAARPGVQLLPGFDEYLLGFKDRSAMLTREQEARVVPGGNGMFLGTVVAGGRVVGTWGRRATASHVTVTVRPFGELSATRRRGVDAAAEAYGRFAGRPVTVTYAG